MKIGHIGEIVRNVTASVCRAVDATAAGDTRGDASGHGLKGARLNLFS